MRAKDIRLVVNQSPSTVSKTSLDCSERVEQIHAFELWIKGS